MAQQKPSETLSSASVLQDVSVPNRPNQTLQIIAPADVINSYQAFVGARNVLAIKDFKSPDLWRDPVELVLFHQALDLGGYDKPIELVAGNNYKRILRDLTQARIGFSGVSVWRADISDSHAVLISEPLLRRGEYRVGLYAAADNKQAMAVKTADDLRQLSAVSTPHWSADWTELQRMPWKELHEGPSMKSMMRMVGAKRSDVLLMAFRTSKDFSITDTQYGYRLMPIPNVVVVLHDSRHWVASSEVVGIKEPFQALQRGLAILRQRGLVKRAYQQVGVLDVRVKNWSVLNTE